MEYKIAIIIRKPLKIWYLKEKTMKRESNQFATKKRREKEGENYGRNERNNGQGFAWWYYLRRKICKHCIQNYNPAPACTCNILVSLLVFYAKVEGWEPDIITCLFGFTTLD